MRAGLLIVAVAGATAAACGQGAGSSETAEPACPELSYIEGDACAPLVIGDGALAESAPHEDAVADAGTGDGRTEDGEAEAMRSDGSGALTYLMNPAHTNSASDLGLIPPLSLTWTAALDGQVSYPLVVGDRVYVTTDGSQMSLYARLYALSAHTGAVAWAVDLGQEGSASVAYEGGRVVALGRSGHLFAFDATDGLLQWTAVATGQRLFSSPVAYRGIVYVCGAGSDGTLYAFDEANGTQLWQVGVGGGSAPAVSDDGVFSNYGCQNVAAFDRLTGALLWKHSGVCGGGADATPVLFGRTLYVVDGTGNLALDVATGATTGTFTADAPPAFEGASAFFLADAGLTATDLAGGTTWRFSGDGHLATPPLVVDGTVYEGSTAGRLFGVRAFGGAPAWSVVIGAAAVGPGYGAGAGILAVPVEARLLAFTSASPATVDAGMPDSADAAGCAWSLIDDAQAPAAGAEPTAIAMGDFNLDGRLDLAVSNSYEGSVSILLGNGDGTFRMHQDYVTGTGAAGLVVGDVNKDGRPDAVVAATYSAYDNDAGLYQASVLLGNGDGTLQPYLGCTTDRYPASVAMADLNADGKPDLAMTTASGEAVVLGNGDGTFQTSRTYDAGGSPAWSAIGDMNGDGKPDLVVTEYTSNTVGVMPGIGDGTFGSRVAHSTQGTPGQVVVGDVNRDGKIDAVISCAPADVQVLIGNGDGTLRDAVSYPIGARAQGIALGDLNGDGKIDIAAANTNMNTLSVLLGNGDGTFQPQTVFVAGTTPNSVAAGDLNGDGKEDIAIADQANGVSVLLGTCGP